MSKLKRLEAMEQMIRQRCRRDADLIALTVSGFESHAASLLERADGLIPLRIGEVLIAPAPGEQLAAFEARVHTVIRSTVEGEQLPLNLADFYRLMPATA